MWFCSMGIDKKNHRYTGGLQMGFKVVIRFCRTSG